MNLPKSIDAVIALLGIQLSGNIYVPLNIEIPGKEKILAVLGSNRVLEHAGGEFRLGGKIFANAHDTDMENSVLEKLSARKSENLHFLLRISSKWHEHKNNRGKIPHNMACLTAPSLFSKAQW